MRIFVPVLFVFLFQNLFLFRWCWCCQHHSSQQAVSVSRCSYSKTRAFYSFSSNDFFFLPSSFRFFAAFSRLRSLVVFTHRRRTEEREKPIKRATRATNSSFSQSHNALNNLLKQQLNDNRERQTGIKTDDDGTTKA